MAFTQIILLSYPDYAKLGDKYFFTFRIQNNFLPVPLMYYTVDFQEGPIKTKFTEGPVFYPPFKNYVDFSVANIAGIKGVATYTIKVGLLPGPSPFPTLDEKIVSIKII